MSLAAIAVLVVGSSMAVAPCEATANVLVPVRRAIPVDGAKRIESEDERRALQSARGTVAVFAISTNSAGRIVGHKLVCTTMNDAALSTALRALRNYVFESGEPLEGQVLLRLAIEENQSN